MANENLVNKWQKKIVAFCEVKLARKLSDKELIFIQNQNGFIGLEMVEENVHEFSIPELKSYLNSEIRFDFFSSLSI